MKMRSVEIELEARVTHEKRHGAAALSRGRGTDAPDRAKVIPPGFGETVETVKLTFERSGTSLKRGVNEILSFHLQLLRLVDTGQKVKFTNALLALDSRIS
jgi:hypothetical protein